LENTRGAARQVAALAVGWRIVVVRGSGPQEVVILLWSELAKGDSFIPRLSHDMSVADSHESWWAGARRNQARAITAAAGRTTVLSAAWLDHAARGELSAEVEALLVSPSPRMMNTGT
jgi:hypothetical protein